MEDITKAHTEGFADGQRAGENYGVTKTLESLSMDRYEIAAISLGYGKGMTGELYKAKLESVADAIQDWCETGFIMEEPPADDGSYSEYPKGQ